MSDDTNTTAPAPEQPTQGKTFAQADVDRIVGERSAKARKAAESEAAQLRAELEALRTQYEEATGKLSETDKVTRKLTEAEKRAAKAEETASAHLSRLHKTLVGYEAARIVGGLQLRDPASAAVIREDLERRLRVGEGERVEYVEGDEAKALDPETVTKVVGARYGWALQVASGSGSPHGRGKAPSPGDRSLEGLTPAEIFARAYKAP